MALAATPGWGASPPWAASGDLSRSYLTSIFRADWDTAMTAATKVPMAAGLHAAPVPKPRSSRTVLRAPACDPDSQAMTAGTANMASASDRVTKAAHPSALTATLLCS